MAVGCTARTRVPGQQTLDQPIHVVHISEAYRSNLASTSLVAAGRSPKASTTVAPTERRRSTLPSYVPRQPSMMAPAWLKRVPLLAALPPI